jgi:serine/threonine protein kinase
MTIDINKPAKYLTGKTLEGGWLVKENVTKTLDYGATSFSETYLLEKNGQTAILKALDFSIALLSDDPTASLIQLSKSYDFEKELLELCKSKRLTKIINIIAQGNIPPISGSIIPVPYFILEYADRDIKSQIDFDSRFNTTWLLRILHNVTVGLFQLHNQGVAHTDVRPENIVEFSKSLQKITELGRSNKKGIENPNKDFGSANDPSYMTPEYLYGHEETDWVYKSQASDVYQLGGLIFFLFTQSNFNTWLYHFLDDSHKRDNWGGTYNEVLPYLTEAYDKAVYFFTAYVEDEDLKSKLEITLRQLCHPDPRKRGHPRDIESIGSSMSVERFITQFDRLAILSEINLAKIN